MARIARVNAKKFMAVEHLIGRHIFLLREFKEYSMQVIDQQQTNLVGGGNGIEAQEWACLVMIMKARNESTSWSEYAAYCDMYVNFRASYMADWIPSQNSTYFDQ